MPTKKKRVGFIPRGDVMKIIAKLSIENNLSNSKIISILVEEALSLRGIFNQKTGREIELYQKIEENTKDLYVDAANFKDNKKFIKNIKSGNHKNPGKTNLLKQSDKAAFDLQTYKKFLSFLKFQEMIDEYNTQ